MTALVTTAMEENSLRGCANRGIQVSSVYHILLVKYSSSNDGAFLKISCFPDALQDLLFFTMYTTAQCAPGC